MSVRFKIPDFELANPIYAMAGVTVYTVDESGAKTSTKATLYASIAGSSLLANPQTLDSEGKFSQPVYADEAVIASVSGLTVGDHDTGVIAPSWNYRGAWATSTLYGVNDVVQISDSEDSDEDGNYYVCTARHTAGVFATDRDTNGYWGLFLDTTLAMKWASEAEDVLVDATEYSAKHYAAKSATYASTAQTAAAGIKGKDTVKAATTANITLSGEQTLDTIALVSGDRALAKDQTNTEENGIYIVSAGAWARATDADSWDEIVGMWTTVEQGAANADKGFLCISDSGGVLETTPIVFVSWGLGDLKSTNDLSDIGSASTARDNLGAAAKLITENPQTGTTYTTVLSDAEKLVTLENAAPITLTIPINAVTAYPIGTTIAFQQIGVGIVTMEGAGVTFRSRLGLVSAGQYAIWSITKVATDKWSVVGDLTT